MTMIDVDAAVPKLPRWRAGRSTRHPMLDLGGRPDHFPAARKGRRVAVYAILDDYLPNPLAHCLNGFGFVHIVARLPASLIELAATRLSSPRSSAGRRCDRATTLTAHPPYRRTPPDGSAL